MRLIKASASGYKRLAPRCELNLDTDPVCIVGPNAAGKSSFLDALVHLNDDRAFTAAEGTRVPGGDRMEPSIEARFELDEEDREELDDISEARQVSQLLVYKDEANGLYYRADPFPERDLSKRHTVQAALEQLQEVDWPAQAQAVEAAQAAPPDPLLDALFNSALALAEDDDQEIESQASAFDALGGRIGAILGQIEAREQATEEGEEYEGPIWPEFPAGLRGLPADLAVLAAWERDDHPMAKVEQRLKSRVPRFLKFDDHARDLETRYDLNEEAPEPDRGIHNFLALAGTTWHRAHEVSQQEDPGLTKVYQGELDKQLKEKAALKWGQSDITIAVSLNPPILSVVISMQERDFIGFTEHSDGLKAFVALRAFVARAAVEDDDQVGPIVLVDEADRHLHYDAQADLVVVPHHVVHPGLLEGWGC